MHEAAPWIDSDSLTEVLARIAKLEQRQREILSDLAQCRAQIAEIEEERRTRIAALLTCRPPAEEERAVDGN